MEAVGHERIFLDLLERLKHADLERLAARKGLKPRPDGKVLIESLGASYLVDRGGVQRLDGGPVRPKEGLAVLGYLFSPGTGEPAGEFVPFRLLGGFNLGRATHELRRLKVALLARFGNDYASFAAVARKVGGIEEEAPGAGQHAWQFPVFPKLLVKLVFNEADEDFPPDIHLLFDARALEFFGFECLGFLPDYFVSKLIEVAREG
ncbi:DUF3786 domain-containing protein [Deferrisoma sp.]